jgi:Ni,Fe-hydrogenase maturation factor
MIEANPQGVATGSDRAAESARQHDWQVFGVGSPHGDDQIGWLLAATVAETLGITSAPRILRTPSELLSCDDLTGPIMICDGCRSGLPVGTLRLIGWPNPRIAQERFSGSHDVALPIVLALLARIGRLPGPIWLWTVEIGAVTAGTEISPAALAALSEARIRHLAERGPAAD